MNIKRRTVGWIIMAAASLTLLACVGAMAGVWFLKIRLDAVGDKVFHAADLSLVFLDEKLERVDTGLKSGGRRLRPLLEKTQILPKLEARLQEEAAALVQSMDDDLVEPLKKIREAFEAASSAAVVVGNVSEAILTSQYAAEHEDSVGMEMVQRIGEYSASLIEILTEIEEVRQNIMDLGADAAVVRKRVEAIVMRLARVETRITELSGRIERLRDGIDTMRADASMWDSRCRFWTTLGAVLVSLFLAWLSASQIGMILHARSMIRSDEYLGVGGRGAREA